MLPDPGRPAKEEVEQHNTTHSLSDVVLSARGRKSEGQISQEKGRTGGTYRAEACLCFFDLWIFGADGNREMVAALVNRTRRTHMLLALHSPNEGKGLALEHGARELLN